MPSVNPRQIVGPRVVFVLVGKVVSEVTEDTKATQRSQDGSFGELIEEPVRRRHPHRRRRWGAHAVSILRGARKAHSGFARQILSQGGSETQAGDVIVGVERSEERRVGK